MTSFIKHILEKIKYRFATLTAFALLMLSGISAGAHDKYGVVDRNGHYVIPPNFERINVLSPELFECFGKIKQDSGISDVGVTETQLW